MVKAIKAFFAAGGTSKNLDTLKLSAWGLPLFAWEEDTIGAEVGDITQELLEDAIRLTHPDRHPPERQASAERVTKELIALRPFVFPAPKPEPKPKPIPRDASVQSPRRDTKEPLQIKYPCELCAEEVPYYYCNTCKAKWETIHREEEERRLAKQRAYYRRWRERKIARRGSVECPVCELRFNGKRKDARYCSPACRQRAHRRRVTDKPKLSGELCCNRDAAKQVAA